MTVDNAKFQEDFAKILRKAQSKGDRLVAACAMDVLGKLVERSPVGNPAIWKNPASAPPGYVGGRFKANWQVGVGLINTDTSAQPDASGKDALGRGQGVVNSWKIQGKLYLTNSMPYAKRIEYEHWSQQAPAGVSRLAAMEFMQTITRLAAQIQ
jgi:hypothetical protein